MANSWSGLRQQLETEYLCPKLRGRVQYFLTHYTDAHDDYGRIAIRVDSVERLRGDPFAYYNKGYSELEAGLKRACLPPRQQIPQEMLHGPRIACKEALVRRRAINARIEELVKHRAINDGIFDIYYVTDAIRIYTQSAIGASLRHENPLVRLLAVLDRRVGRRTLLRLAGDVERQPDWLRFFYRLRLDAEGIPIRTADYRDS